MKDYLAKVNETSQFLKSRLEENPEIGLITGTGLGDIADLVDVRLSIDYTEIPHFPSSTVVSHQGNLVFGRMSHQRLMALQGRFHLYEGYSSKEVTFPIRVMQTLGVKHLILLNAAGGLNPRYTPGDIMIITDHVNLTGSNPLMGPNVNQWGERFPEMIDAYDKTLIAETESAASHEKIQVRKGIYAGLKGPSLETPAEIRFLRIIGCDAVGFSTVQEVIAAVHGEMKVLGVSVITNVHDPENPVSVSVEEILDTAKSSIPKINAILRGVIPQLE
jgi:purine-nucleoside phosphorylase